VSRVLSAGGTTEPTGAAPPGPVGCHGETPEKAVDHETPRQLVRCKFGCCWTRRDVRSWDTGNGCWASDVRPKDVGIVALTEGC
jgi:hypothetical protein